MGFLLFLLFVGVTLISEIELTSNEEWRGISFLSIFLFRKTRKRFAFLLAMAVGVLFLLTEIWLTLNDRSTFNFVQAVGLLAILLVAALFSITKKGK